MRRIVWLVLGGVLAWPHIALAQSATTQDDGGLPLTGLLVVVGVVAAAFLTRNLGGMLSRGRPDTEDDHDEGDPSEADRRPKPRRRKRQREGDDPALYMIEDDDVREGDGPLDDEFDLL